MKLLKGRPVTFAPDCRGAMTRQEFLKALFADTAGFADVRALRDGDAPKG